jgi:hypothetical protein
MSEKKAEYSLGGNGEFVVKNYNLSKPFSGFFPGIAGLYGKPMWAFYVNRGQCVCSMGIEGKDGAILEFQPANKAYTLTATHGFRTFIRVIKDGATYYYEPFSEISGHDRENLMSIGPAELYIEEKNHTLGIKSCVRYFCVPNEPFSAMARELTIINETDTNMSFEVIDGIPFILPFGVNEGLAKSMCHTLQAWMHVINLNNKIPLYKLKVVVADKPIVIEVEKGNFYMSYHFDAENKPELLPPIVDPETVFSANMDLKLPYKFFRNGNFEIPQNQIIEGKTPSAFSYIKFDLGNRAKKEIYSMVGHIDKLQLPSLSKTVLNKEYFEKKIEESRKIVCEVQNNMLTESSSYAFDIYCKNTFLDNVLRGGYPITLKEGEKPTSLHVYSRRHGDIERDYNSFSIHPTYYSQGDGNFRDVCQNRRNDIWFNPDLIDENIKAFVNLIQLDGYNPLHLQGDMFILKKIPKELNSIKELFAKPFTIGGLLENVENKKINLGMNKDELIKKVISLSEKIPQVNFREGYWVDHWTYIADLFDSFRSLYPEKYWDLFLSKDCTFFDSPAVVVPKKQKIKEKDGKYRQYGAVIEDEKKKDLIASRKEDPNKVRTRYGKGNIYKTTVLVKLITLIANKYASLDSFGIGIEMEADRPGWYDALNGLPGLFGSSTCETFELKRIITYVVEALDNIKETTVVLPVEIADFLNALFRDVNKKESYRENTKNGISGKETIIPVLKIKAGFMKFIKALNTGIDKAFDNSSGLYNTYYENEVKSLKPLKFKNRPLPAFLEGQVHALRLIQDTKKAKALYAAVKKSDLYDDKLKMYKVNASLKDESLEIGRVKVFTPGWLENESIWVHMEYKYLLELLRNDLYDEYFNDFKNVLIPFQKPEVFGRNILESCSFIVSSAHANNSLHGTGFLPRLTGATAEIIHMWLWMCLGKKPFFINEKNELNMKFEPILCNWLFTSEGTFGFNLFGKTRVVYHNPQQRNTYGSNSVKAFKIMLDSITIQGDIVPAPYAQQIRNKEIQKIDVYMG